MTIMNKDTDRLLRAMGKGELAQLYLPQLSPHSALNRLMEWMNGHPGLMRELKDTGYRTKQRLLTPLQVGIIIKYLGEP